MEEMRYHLNMVNAMNQRLIMNDRMLQMIVGTSSSAFLYCDFDSDKLYSLGNWEHFFKTNITSKKDVSRLFDYFEDEYIRELRSLFSIEWENQEKKTCCVQMKENKQWVEIETTVVYDNFGEPTDKVIRFTDVTKMINQKDELTYMAYFDSLTGLYNRNRFVQLLADMLRKADDQNKTVSVMFVDIDDFRKINDSQGIIVGDMLVQSFGQFLDQFSSKDIIVSHLNSDVFCIAIYNPVEKKSPDAIYKAIVDRLQKPFAVNGVDLAIEVTVGVSEYPSSAKSALELINCAEIVMFKAKGNGKNSIKYFDAAILEDFLYGVNIENQLKRAVNGMEFMIYFQPQYHTLGKKLRGVEALLRWKDENGQMVSPNVFIPIAEKNGTIVSIGAFVIEESIRTYMDWKEKYNYSMVLSLNVSAIQYKQPEFVDNVIGALRKYHMKPEELELEITESILIEDYELITKKLSVLRDYGIKISLDDFGTGYSSLSYLKGLPLDTLKIDKSFVDTLITDQNTQIIMESVMYMVKKLGLETIAEGVETEEQYKYLDDIECDNIQGFYLGRPMAASDIEKVLQKI